CLDNLLHQCLARYAFDRLLAGGIDIQNDQAVRVLKRSCKLVHQITGSGIAMRLEDHMNLAKATLPGGGKGGANFRGMVAVVIDYADPRNLAPQLEATVDAVEVFESRANLLDLEIQANPNGNGRRRVEDVVGSGNAQPELSQVGSTVDHVETADRVVLLVIESALLHLDAKIRASPRTVRHHPARNLRQHAAQNWIVVAEHDHPVKRHSIHEVQKSPLHVSHVAIAIHVFAVDVGHNRQDRRELQKRPVTLVGLRDHVL